MNTVYCCILVPADAVDLARSLAAVFGESACGMWKRPVYKLAEPDPAYYISAGQIDSVFLNLLLDADKLHAAVLSAGGEADVSQCQDLVRRSHVTEAPAPVALKYLGLELRGSVHDIQ